MPSIPSPTIMQLDPNDENIILSIPEDTGPIVKENASTLTPKKVKHKEYYSPLFWLKTNNINFYKLSVLSLLSNGLPSYCS